MIDLLQLSKINEYLSNFSNLHFAINTFIWRKSGIICKQLQRMIPRIMCDPN